MNNSASIPPHLLLRVLVVYVDDDFPGARPQVPNGGVPQREPKRLVVLLPDEEVERLKAARGLAQERQVFLGLWGEAGRGEARRDETREQNRSGKHRRWVNQKKPTTVMTRYLW